MVRLLLSCFLWGWRAICPWLAYRWVVGGVRRVGFLRWLADGAFHFHLDQSVKLDRVFHWEYSGEWFHESGDNHAESLSFGQASGHEIEQLVLIDPSNCCFVGYCRVVLVDFHVGVG